MEKKLLTFAGALVAFVVSGVITITTGKDVFFDKVKVEEILEDTEEEF